MTESSRAPSRSLVRALELARQALAAEPGGLLTDFDGTLSPIVADPARARLVPGVADALRTLARRLAVVAVVTGRAPADARRMTGVPELLVAGNHGTEWLEPGTTSPSRSTDADAARRAVRAVLDRVPPGDGVAIEDKGVSATVHYRTAADPERARRAILDAIGEPGPSIELRNGRMSVEIRPVGLGDKGSATRAIIGRFDLRGAVVLGDDVSDLDMFRAVAEARETGRLRGLVVGVGGADLEVPAEVSAAADVVLATPEEAAALLARLAAD